MSALLRDSLKPGSNAWLQTQRYLNGAVSPHVAPRAPFPLEGR